MNITGHIETASVSVVQIKDSYFGPSQSALTVENDLTFVQIERNFFDAVQSGIGITNNGGGTSNSTVWIRNNTFSEAAGQGQITVSKIPYCHVENNSFVGGSLGTNFMMISTKCTNQTVFSNNLVEYPPITFLFIHYDLFLDYWNNIWKSTTTHFLQLYGLIA